MMDKIQQPSNCVTCQCQSPSEFTNISNSYKHTNCNMATDTWNLILYSSYIFQVPTSVERAHSAHGMQNFLVSLGTVSNVLN